MWFKIKDSIPKHGYFSWWYYKNSSIFSVITISISSNEFTLSDILSSLVDPGDQGRWYVLAYLLIVLFFLFHTFHISCEFLIGCLWLRQF